MVKDEQGRVFLTSMVACLFARGVYSDELLSQCLKSVGYSTLADTIGPVSENIQQIRWKTRIATGFKPEEIVIPQRFYEVSTVKGLVDRGFLDELKALYAGTIRDLGGKPTHLT
jgi:aldehyde:ferredoxin oxidoreductase